MLMAENFLQLKTNSWWNDQQLFHMGEDHALNVD